MMNFKSNQNGLNSSPNKKINQIKIPGDKPISIF